MTTIQVVARFPYVTGLPRDAAVNTFNFIGLDDAETMAAAAMPLVQAFYNTTPTGASNSIASRMSNVISRPDCTTTVYEVNLATGELGEPIAEDGFTLAAIPSPVADLPLEVSVVASFAATGGVGVAGARRRGRVFLGPFTANISTTVSGLPAPNASIRTPIVGASFDLATDSTAADIPLAVWSRADKGAYGVIRGWVDNEFDTQRRRQVDATARDSWAL